MDLAERLRQRRRAAAAAAAGKQADAAGSAAARPVAQPGATDPASSSNAAATNLAPSSNAGGSPVPSADPGLSSAAPAADGVDPARVAPPPGWRRSQDLLWECRCELSAAVPPIPRIAEMVFFDIETTGLSGGAGTMVLLAGAAWVEQGRLVAEQWFAADFPGEVYVLQRIATMAAQRPVVVSYNGRSFDWPVVQSKSLMSGVVLPPVEHLDLLYPVRRLFRHRLPDCSLATVEHARLGVVRINDVPGQEVPYRYAEFTRSGDVQQLLPVFTHHLQDLHSLYHALVYLLELERSAEQASAMPELHDPVGLARLIEFCSQRGLRPSCSSYPSGIRASTEPSGQPTVAAELSRQDAVLATAADILVSRLQAYAPAEPPGSAQLRRMPAAGPDAVPRHDLFRIGRLLVRRYKQRQDYDSARRLLLQLQDCFGPAHRWTAVELAKLLEHQYRDYAGALAALRGLADPPAHRQERVRRKLSGC
ncbi:ribonuclease H-like domain-containing protein [Spirochaeta africana]|uniref:YprB ribonuclease H-like domain-containing protein n=1 Tax=Spirochaeta africana (strain ATCC 700263 / DSM 8902 / Z-7692) TaxID=889378 RepID=H9UH90_SPIAZ|nr:ribonuclease H-like domain-containing protein [Spirochaeta africana]AFG36883.1 hypothetical protein Spiaf_0789 [Spirochaeta africana DSM 8902]